MSEKEVVALGLLFHVFLLDLYEVICLARPGLSVPLFVSFRWDFSSAGSSFLLYRSTDEKGRSSCYFVGKQLLICESKHVDFCSRCFSKRLYLRTCMLP